MKKVLYILLSVSIVFTACKKEEGCTDPVALNYNSDAEEDDSSCNYESTFSLNVSGDSVISGNADMTLTSHLTVTNTSNKALNVRCRINPINQTSGTQFLFCWAEACYAEGTLISTNTVSMNSGQVVTFPDLTAHSGYYNAFGEKDAIAEIEYCFYDDANPEDETCFTVTFSPTASK